MILVVNAGSSSVKVALFGPDLSPGVTAQAIEIGGAARLRLAGQETAMALPDHAAAMAALLAALAGAGHPVGGLTAAAHRVVHGGAALAAPARITPGLRGAIAACVPLAPLHNPANLAGIDALAALAPDLPQFASFDTAFHATIPEVAARYALPPEAEALGLRRYGFHGLSYAAMVAGWDGPLPRRLLAFHLGNGASACAILEGRSVATSMGYSPLAGLTMGTRTGDIDGSAVLRLAEVHGIGGAARLLNRESGLKGLGGASDMRALRAAGTAEADFAIGHFAYWAVRHGGSLAAAMGGVDAIAFTGGIGENDADMRDRIAAGLRFLNPHVAIVTVAAAEERQIAAEAMATMAASGAGER
jgi:acetate kinase